jgi:hypothetical protein
VVVCGIPESKFGFTTVSFGRTMMAPFVHNNDHCVIGKIHISDLPFQMGTQEWEFLQEIVGARLNVNRNELRLTSYQFGSRMEN